MRNSLGKSIGAAEAVVRAEDYAVTLKLQWLALLLTPGVGAGRSRKFVEHFDGIE
jgi:hypothetical protein